MRIFRKKKRTVIGLATCFTCGGNEEVYANENPEDVTKRLGWHLYDGNFYCKKCISSRHANAERGVGQ